MAKKDYAVRVEALHEAIGSWDSDRWVQIAEAEVKAKGPAKAVKKALDGLDPMDVGFGGCFQHNFRAIISCPDWRFSRLYEGVYVATAVPVGMHRVDPNAEGVTEYLLDAAFGES